MVLFISLVFSVVLPPGKFSFDALAKWRCRAKSPQNKGRNVSFNDKQQVSVFYNL